MLGKGGNIYEIKKICKENNIKLIEDNCESFGAKLDERMLGTIGDLQHVGYVQHVSGQ